MTAPVHLVVPGPLDQRTGGYIYDKRIAEGLQAQGWSVQAHELAGAFPQVDGMARAAAEAVLPALADGVAVIDGLALPAFDGLLERLPARWLALVHHPLALETGLGSAAAEALAALEGRLLHHAPRIVVTSPRTRRDLAMFALPPERIGVVLPGTAPAPRARGSGGREVGLLCVASLTPRKGHLVLLAALAGLQDLAWRLVCVGSAERDPATAAAIRAAIAAHGLAERVRLVPEQDAAGLAAYYDAADLFVLASHHEGYGMVLAEALARGLPIVATTAGAIPDTVPPLAGRLVPPGDAGALAATLRRLIANPAARTRLAEGARLVRKSLPDWPDAVRGFARELALLGGA